ncbi:hypothetical protein [Halodurantibacterium flavum]|uniref:Uncharacterized protein n=1 Tax=Halodurantibacterium flavum TaxID=1382802 RepID=A0ABW4S4A1_9RHOB
MRLVLAACLVAMPAALQAQAPMTGDEFDAYTQGRTLTFSSGGVPYGIEQYLPNREVIWAFVGQECRRGKWFDNGGQICFTYEKDGALQCWIFRETEEGLSAQFQDGTGAGTELVEVEQSSEPLSCPGPDVGV